MIPFSDDDLREPVRNIIENKIAPMLARDGGSIILLKIKDAKIYVQLQGACVGCAASGSTLKFVVDKELKAYIHPDIKVVNVPVGMENNLDLLEAVK